MNLFSFIIILLTTFLTGNIISVGSGSYTTIFPGVDAAGRNSYPSGSPQLTGPALYKKTPTNDWWSKVIKENHADNLFNYPMALKTINEGLVTSYIPWGVYDDQEPIINGITNLNVSESKVYDFSDWTVTLDWSNENNFFRATSGIGMPFIYFTKDSESLAQVKVNLGSVTVIEEKIIIEDARNGADFVIYAPSGSVWNQNGIIYTSDLNGQNYWSMVMLPDINNNLIELSEEYSQFAYVFPENTYVEWDYNQSNSILTTEFFIDVDIKEGTFSKILQGILPHQWNNLAIDSPYPESNSYQTVRGELKVLEDNYFKTQNKFVGILPTLPNLAHYSEGFNPSELESKVNQITNDQLSSWTDSYNEGQVMNRLIQTARIADQIGNENALNTIIETIKNRLEDWLTANSNEIAFIFYYNENWSTMIGYPAGHGQDYNINDHHFHWGYFIHAAAFIEQYNPGWAESWGDMINHLIRDAASSDRNDLLFPFLRSFSPFAGHCWANGFATFPQGNDQESSSESMQFNSSLIHWGSVTNNTEIRDLGIYLYTTEQTAIDEYWFDMYERNFSSNYPYSLVSRVWGNSYDNGTFWTNDIAASYGIELYPIHGGSFYLCHNLNYVSNLWSEIVNNTGIMFNEENPNLWHDVYWQYLSFIDPSLAIELHDSNPNRNLKFGISDAQTYHWIHNMNVLGELRSDISSNHPIALSFNKDGENIYVAHNYLEEPITVIFSDGYELDVGPRQIKTNKESELYGIMSSEFDQAYQYSTINLEVDSYEDELTKVEFYKDSEFLGEDLTFPYSFTAQDLPVGVHSFYGKIFSNTDISVTNVIYIQVGEQGAYTGAPFVIPGTIESGHYDSFQDANAQNVSYFDNTQANLGTYRLTESVDVEFLSNIEGPTLGWIESGEWVEYSIYVEESGYYDLEFRYASDNSGGGGPFYFEINGEQISNNISVTQTGGWNNWTTQSISNIKFTTGEHILRITFVNGQFNLGKMSFFYDRPLEYNPPVADAGEDIVLNSQDNSVILDASLSYDPDLENLNYFWDQVYGPNIATNSNLYGEINQISNLIQGVYKFKLTVDDGMYSSIDNILIFKDFEIPTEPCDDIVCDENDICVDGECINIPSNPTVTFLVDMSDQEIDETGVYVSGSDSQLAGPSGLLMLEQENDVWSLTLDISPGTYTYKFRNGFYDYWDSPGWEPNLPQECGFGQWSDRQFTFSNIDLVLGPYFFGSCEISESSSSQGDINNDGVINVVDVVSIVEIIIYNSEYIDTADYNNDGIINVVDIIGIINIILN
tara:strand:+ start:398 stop:4249 length:3852 start_codon:yes stop_codon:yes gene_type:complete